MAKRKKGAGGQPGAGSNLHLGNNTKEAQRARLLHYLRETGPLTTLQARNLLNVMHPGGRIMELRRNGFQILMTWVIDFQENFSHRVGQYTLIGEQGGAQ
jgi:hypothetical protein